ncbi:coiled-coil domain-containing protein 96-like [Salvia splendens]|uniref:coiled-coil domain-containing protein 96-like n=1 Tax=Salvia splendens TaxID=180675 RepID=UPI001C25E551|nr:coiled-coil domain-containing protein 96-like [Salvia splendens]
MTDDEFQAILDGVNQREDDTATMVEDLNLTSRAVGEDEEGRAGEKEPESVNPQTEAGKSDVHVEAEETEARPEVPNLVAPPVTKPKVVKRKLVLKGEPESSRPMPQRSVGLEEQRIDNACTRGETDPTTQDPLSTQAEKEPEEEKDEDDREEARYQVERKRKGKGPVKKKPSSKRQHTFNTGVVITEATQRTPPNRRESSDNDYTASDESESDSDTSIEDEEYKEQQLPGDHRELLHPPAERLRFRRWAVELTDELVEEMKLFDSKKLQDAFGTKDDKSKQVKCGKGIPRFYAMGEEAIPAGRATAAQGTPAQEQRQERLEKTVAELADDNRKARAELSRLATVVEGILKELATGKLVV